jgi:methylated-DNA-[protein]-cysteine S-methyltransferase
MKTFTEKVYEVTKKIPEGLTFTSKKVAMKVGKPKAYRAVGTILSKNFNPEIPCHRVIRSDGGMGGYNRGGVNIKSEILMKEKLQSQNK